jgi:hypothetical protein
MDQPSPESTPNQRIMETSVAKTNKGGTKLRSMSLINRTHAITFRLDAREYEQLLKTVANTGARSLSYFTRTAVLNQIIADSLNNFLKEELDTLISSLDSFDSKVRDLRRQLRQFTTKSDEPVRMISNGDRSG